MMKTFKYILSTFLLISVIWSCTDDELNDLDFLDSAVAPTNVEALFTITQDNTGTVTIIPTAENATTFEVDFGDGNKTESAKAAGKSVEHIYAEGTYTVNIIAIGVTGLKAELTNEIVVSFNKPVFGTNPIIENDEEVSKQVNVTVPADTEWAMSYDVYFVEDGIETIVTGNIGAMVSYTYENPGMVDIRVVLNGGAIETTEYVLEGFEVTEILTPIVAAPTPDGRSEVDYISIFSDAYTNIEGSDYNPMWWQATLYSMFDLEGDEMLQYSNLNYQGIQIGLEGTSQDVTSMEYLHVDVWTPKDLASVKFFPLPVGVSSEDEKFKTLDLVEGEWSSFDIPLSFFTDQGLPLDQIHQFKFEGENSGTIFVDNLYFWREASVVVDPNVIFDDFEGNGTVEWFEDAATLNNALENPFINGDNNSATVLEYNDNGTGQYANIQVRLGQKLDLTLGSVFSLKIYVPSSSITGTQENTLALKLQNNELGGNAWTTQVEIKEAIILDAWQVVTFDFVDVIDRTDFDQIVFQVNGENNFDEVIAYIDDFSYGDSISSGTKLVVFDDFEGNGNVTEWFEDALTLNDALANPFSDEDNNSATVLEYNDNGTGQYANIQVRLNEKFDLTNGSVFSLKIYVPTSTITGTQENTLALKLQNNELGGNAWTTQVEIKKPIVLDAWQVVTFDFVDAIDRTDLDQIVLQVNGENNFDEVIAYIDDFKYNK